MMTTPIIMIEMFHAVERWALVAGRRSIYPSKRILRL